MPRQQAAGPFQGSRCSFIKLRPNSNSGPIRLLQRMSCVLFWNHVSHEYRADWLSGDRKEYGGPTACRAIGTRTRINRCGDYQTCEAYDPGDRESRGMG